MEREVVTLNRAMREGVTEKHLRKVQMKMREQDLIYLGREESKCKNPKTEEYLLIQETRRRLVWPEQNE